MFKLVAMDLDETLLNPDKKVSPRASDILRRLREKGVHIAIASGRILRTEQIHASSFCDRASYVAYNGSVVVFEDGSRWEATLSPDILREIASYCAEHRHHMQTYHDEKIYCAKNSPELMSDMDTKNTCVVEVGDMVKADLPPSPKAVIVDHPEVVPGIVSDLREAFPSLKVTRSSAWVIEVNPPDVDKANGLDMVCRNLGITKDDVIVFGDNNNDLSMIQWAGCGVAVANALPEIKEVADRVSPKEMSEGVAVVLEEVFADIL